MIGSFTVQGHLSWATARSVADTEVPRTARDITHDQRVEDVIAIRALKRVQVDTPKCRHDADEHHLGLADRTGRTFNCRQRNAAPGLRIWHDASLEQVGVENSRSRSESKHPFGSPAGCSILLELSAVFADLFQNGDLIHKKGAARLAGGPSPGRKRPTGLRQRGATAHSVLQMEKMSALTGLNCWARLPFAYKFLDEPSDHSARVSFHPPVTAFARVCPDDDVRQGVDDPLDVT